MDWQDTGRPSRSTIRRWLATAGYPTAHKGYCYHDYFEDVRFWKVTAEGCTTDYILAACPKCGVWAIDEEDHAERVARMEAIYGEYHGFERDSGLIPLTASARAS